jgi:uncharacterized protein (TIGR03067 family)
MTALLLATALLVPAADAPKLSEAAEKELKKFEGKWKLVKEITSAGEQEPPEERVIEFKGRKMSLVKGEKIELEISSLDPTTDPKCIDLKNVTKTGPIPEGFVIEGIYKLDGDTLTMAGYAGEAKKRPANFDPPKEEATGIWVLKRIKD